MAGPVKSEISSGHVAPQKVVQPCLLVLSPPNIFTLQHLTAMSQKVEQEEEYEVLPEHKPNPKVAVVVAGAAVGWLCGLY